MSIDVWQDTLAAAVVAAVPLIYAACGSLLNEKVGVLNYGIEGVMLIGAVLGFIVASETGNAVLGLLVGAAAGAVFVLVLFAVPVVFLRASMLLMSFALWFIGAGVSSQIGTNYSNRPLAHAMQPWEIPLLSDIPFAGKILFAQIWPAYLGVAIVVGVWFLLTRTRHGLSVRSLGEDPASAYASGVRVAPWRLFYVSVGGLLMGLGGAVLSVAITQGWQTAMTSGRGFIAFALVIFAAWRPLGLLWTSIVVGFMLVLASVGQAQGWSVPSEFLSMAPYLVTIAALIVQALIVRRRGGGSPAPTALGADFYKGQR